MPQLIYIYTYMSIVLPFWGCYHGHLQLIALVIPHLRNRKIRYDIGFSVGTNFGVVARGKAILQMLALVRGAGRGANAVWQQSIENWLKIRSLGRRLQSTPLIPIR